MSGYQPSVSKNVVANLIANSWMAAISLVLVPIYIQLLGIEAYGLIGIYTTLTALVTILDFGLTTTLTRETARMSSDLLAFERARSLVRTLEIVYWGIGGLIALVLLLLTPLLSTRWLTTVELSPETVRQALVLICCVIVAQWPFSFYSGGLLGLQRQVQLSAVQASIATVRAIGVIVVLTFVSPTIQVFFEWQLIVSVASTLIVAAMLWRYLPKEQSTYFDTSHLKRIQAFALGITGVSILSLASTQTDKIVLSKTLTLQQFGYYALAGVVASSIYMIVNPLYERAVPSI